MLFSRIDVRPSARKIVIESTAIGMEELTVSPILRARYTLEALKINPSSTPRMRARGVSSAGKGVAGGGGAWLGPRGGSRGRPAGAGEGADTRGVSHYRTRPPRG